MTKLRIILADDEPLARARVRALLPSTDQYEIVGETGTGLDTLAIVERDRPDILLLDIQMPGCDGLAVAGRLPVGNRPAIIFVTAHEHFAVSAFAVDAVDYLLKPFDRSRLEAALARAAAHLAGRRALVEGGRPTDPVAPVPARPPDRFAVRCDGRVVFIRSDEIMWVEAAGNYAVLHLGDGRRFMLRESLSALEERFGTGLFARVNRSAIVRVDEVRELHPTAGGDHAVRLRNGLTLPLSRQWRGRMEQFIAGGLG